MCVNKKWIKNQYTGKDILVNCGHCPACLQEKADLRKRKINAYIKKYSMDDSVQLFVTLGYHNDFIPYVEKNDLDGYLDNEITDLPIYRDTYIKRVFNSNHKISGKVQIGSLIKKNEDLFDYGFEDRRFKQIRKKVNGVLQEVPGKIGVLLQKDIQDFIKRLRQYLKRKYGFTRKFYYFYCGEYGETYHRPHFHIYFIAPNGTEQMFYDSILANWWYESDDFMEKHRRIERARKPAAYISSYVNCHSFLPLFFLENSFRPCFRGATGCEFRCEDYTYDSIISKIRRRTTRVSCKVYKDGVFTCEYVPLPSFIGSRYFPKFKGYSRLNDNQIHNAILTLGQSLRYSNAKDLIDYTDDDFKQIFSLFRNVFNRLNISTFDDRIIYAYYYIDFWNIRSSEIMKDFYSEMEMQGHPREFYDNVSQFIIGKIRSPTLEKYHLQNSELNPNNYVINRQNDIRLREKYNKYDKSKRLNSLVFEV